jgi:hypothetical protein
MKAKVFLLSVFLIGFLAINVHAQKLKAPTVPKISEQPQMQKTPTLPKVPELPKMQIPSKDFSKDLLKALNPGTGLNVSPDKLLKLKKGNTNFVNSVMGVLGGSGSDSDKLNQINKKKDERKGFIEELLGKSKAGVYFSLAKKQVEKLKTKYALAKLFM